MSFGLITPTPSHLLTALLNGRVSQMEEILEQKDVTTGAPVVDINHLRPPRSSEDQTAFRVTLYSTRFFEVSKDTRNTMATCILEVVDRQGNPVLELNGRDSQGDTILDQVKKAAKVDKLYESDARVLSSRILNLRNVDGSRAFQPPVNELINMRNTATQEGNAFLLHQIDDLRNADGVHVIPTAGQPQPNPNTPRITKAHQWQPLPTAPPEVQIFQNNPQNVYDVQIEQSVLRSLISLCKKYFSVKKFSEGWSSAYAEVFNTTFDEIKNYVSGSVREDKELIENGLNFILNTPFSHAAIYLSLKQILCLIWIAAADATAPCPPNPHMDSLVLTRLRKEAVLDRIFDAETVYEHGRSCTGGYVKNLVTALSQAHECVNILLVGSGILSAATDSLKFWILQKIKKFPLDLQKAILSSWDDIEDGSNNAAHRFHGDPIHIQEMFSKLETNYPVSEKLKNQILDAWYSLPRPSLHQELDQLLNQIFGMYAPNERTPLYQFDQAFQSFGGKTIQNSCSFQEAYEQLKKEYETYLDVRRSLAFLDNFSEYFSDSKSLKDLELIIKNLDSHGTISSAKELILDEINNTKMEIRKILLMERKTAPLKNLLMLFLPIVGWAVLLYRFFTKETAFFPRPSLEKIDLLESSII